MTDQRETGAIDVRAPRNAIEVIRNEPFADYLQKSAQYLTSHQLADFRRSPKLYKRKKDGRIVNEDKRVYVIGRALHTLVLEGREAFDALFQRGGPINPKTGNQYGTETKAWAEYEAEIGKVCLGDTEYAQITEMAESVTTHGDWVPVGMHETCEAEITYRGVLRGMNVQGRIDYRFIDSSDCIWLVDVKTVSDLDRFVPQIAMYGYAHQMAFYRVLEELRGEASSEICCAFMCVEKADPFRAQLVELDNDLLTHCENENGMDMNRLRYCYETDIWPAGCADTITVSKAQYDRTMEVINGAR